MILLGVFGVDIKPGKKPFKNIPLIYLKSSRCVSKTSFDRFFFLLQIHKASSSKVALFLSFVSLNYNNSFWLMYRYGR